MPKKELAKGYDQVANVPGTGSSSTRWPTYQARATAQPGDRLDAVRQVPPLLQAAARPGGQRTRHRQQLNQVIASMW